MESIDSDKTKPEKVKASRSYNRFCSVGFLLRVSEISVALLLLCWIFTSLPFAAKISGNFFRHISYFVSTPLFMFVLGNSIVIALLTTNSTVFSASGRKIGGDGGETESDIYETFTRSNSADGDSTEATIVYDDKQIIATETDSNSTVAREDHEEDSVPVTESAKDQSPPPSPTKVYRRSKSEVSEKHSTEIVSKPSLRRSETEKCRKIIEEEVPFPEDNLSNEEFQKTIEAFIAKQLIFRRRESLAVVIHNTDVVESI